MQHGLFNFASFPKGGLSTSNTSGLRPLNSNTEVIVISMNSI
jgi:hypothetical protein